MKLMKRTSKECKIYYNRVVPRRPKDSFGADYLEDPAVIGTPQ
jgi:hypothetical protein